MSKIIYVAFRNPPKLAVQERKIKSVCDGLNPENISAAPTYFFGSNKIMYGVSNPKAALETKAENVVLGKFFGPSENWEIPQQEYPDGNYAIFRANEDTVEVATDGLGTRSIWYYFDEEIFVAATSQRAIINYLGNFQFDNRVIPWMISTGSLGPSHAWDKRIGKVPADGAVTVDKNTWNLSTKYNLVKFSQMILPIQQQEEKLFKALSDTFDELKINFSDWAITLSGGYDSRALLLFFKKFNNNLKKNFRTLTWGEKKGEHDKEGDIYIAKKVAANLGTDHSFFSTELSQEHVEVIMERFLKNGEGRIDHIAGYLDGFMIWKDLYENGIDGIIRGDEVFGYNKIFSPLIIKSFMGLTTCSEFSNLRKYSYINTLHQELPEYLERQPKESIHTWRDRIFQQYRIPFIQSALADLKYPYLEQINPFLSRKIFTVMRQLPDELRTNKALFKMITQKIDIDVPYSKRDSNGLVVNIVKQEKMVQLIKDELSSNNAKTIFPESFLNQVLNNLTVENKKEKIKSNYLLGLIKQSIPLNIRKFLSQRRNKLDLDENVLGFRILMICKMHNMLQNL